MISPEKPVKFNPAATDDFENLVGKICELIKAGTLVLAEYQNPENPKETNPNFDKLKHNSIMIDKSIYKDIPAYYHYYLDLMETTNLIAELEKSKQSTRDLIWGISGNMENYAYAENKWTIKEVFRHIIDCERIFTYRAFRFSRFDNTELTGFEEEEYIAGTKTMEYDLKDLLDEYLNLRNATINLFNPMTDDMLDFKGMANNGSFTARTLGYITVGHNTHHCDFVKRKYLNDK